MQTHPHPHQAEPLGDKPVATVAARAALLGLVLEPKADGWALVNGARRVELASLQAAQSLVYACEAARDERLALTLLAGGAP